MHVRDIRVCDIRSKYPNHQLIVLGDFNLPLMKWSSNSLQYKITSYLSPVLVSGARSILECYSYLDMEQHYPMHKAKQYILDLLFAERGNILLAHNCDQLLCTDEHHEAVLFFTKSPSVVDYMYQNFYKANFNLINSRLSAVDWDGLFTIGDLIITVINFITYSINKLIYLFPFNALKLLVITLNVKVQKLTQVKYKLLNLNF